MADTTADALVNAMNVQSERSVLGQVGLGFGLHNSLAHDIFRAQTEAVEATTEAASATQLSVEKTAAAGLLATNVASGALGVQAEKIGAAVNLAIEKTSAAGALLATQFAGQAALTAAQNKADSDAKAAECCCELKELIRAEAGATRDLINTNTQQDLRERLSTANAALLSLKAQVIV